MIVGHRIPFWNRLSNVRRKVPSLDVMEADMGGTGTREGVEEGLGRPDRQIKEQDWVHVDRDILWHSYLPLKTTSVLGPAIADRSSACSELCIILIVVISC